MPCLPLNSNDNHSTMTLNPRLGVSAPKAALKLFLPLSLVSIALVVGELKANAETPSTVKAATSSVASNGAAALGQPSIETNQINFNQNRVTQEFAADARFSIAQSTPSTPSDIAPGRAVPGNAPSGGVSNPADTTPVTPTTTTTPSTTPGTTTTPETTPSGTTAPGTTTTPEATPSGTTPVTPTSDFVPGRATRSGSSYIGIGGNIGIGDGDIALGQGSFAVLSKIGLTRNFSVRPSVLFSDDVAILLPITYDFSFGEGLTGDFGFTAAPFLGIGAAISTGRGGDVGLLLTGGIDVPLSSQFTATASVNASVTGQAAVGVLLGIGYNFAGF